MKAIKIILCATVIFASTYMIYTLYKSRPLLFTSQESFSKAKYSSAIRKLVADLAQVSHSLQGDERILILVKILNQNLNGFPNESLKVWILKQDTETSLNTELPMIVIIKKWNDHEDELGINSDLSRVEVDEMDASKYYRLYWENGKLEIPK